MEYKENKINDVNYTLAYITKHIVGVFNHTAHM